MNMSIFAKFLDIEQKYKVRLHEGENFKQALYNDKMTDSDDCIIDKIVKRFFYLLIHQMKHRKFHFTMP